MRFKHEHPVFSTFNSNYTSLTFDSAKGRLMFFGVESGGRDWDRHGTYSVLMPSYGAICPAFEKQPPLKEKTVRRENTLVFENAAGARQAFTMEDDRRFSFTFENTSGPLMKICFSIRRAPLTIWADEHKKKNSRNKNCLFATQYSLPLIIHFPDFGLVRISADEGVTCEEELITSREYTGLDLGAENYGYHNQMHALHYGCSRLTFRSAASGASGIHFEIMEEVYPDLDFEGGGDEAWNGLRRQWMNSFALNREYFDMGDNIMLHGRGHLAVHMKSDLMQLMSGENPLFKLVRETFKRQILNGFLYAQADDGEVNFSYINRPKGREPMCGFIDSTPASIIATCGIAHWDREFAEKLLPYALRTADFILTLDKDDDGIFEVPFSGNSMDEKVEYGDRQRNWWDNFAFGHKDIYFNYLCHRALRELRDLLIESGRKDAAEKYAEQLALFDAHFFDTFYDPETGVMAGWISADGRMHDYMFTFAVSMGIDEGLIPPDKGRDMLKILLAKMQADGYGDLRYGIPGNLIPVADPDTIHWPCMSDWGRYENGGLCGMNGFHFLTSMYRVGMREEADRILKAILNTYEKELTHSGLMPGYVQSVDWRTREGNPCGYNYLADNYYFLLAVYTGHAGIRHPAVAAE
ncbi:MAG: hypothetical protein K5784_10270 [Clostridiales bacterium]|nr:hypothetical protein [Clostridiales bacterium]